MDGSSGALRFPVAAPPAPGETLPIAPGVWWLRMPLPFALDHINLWLIEDGPGWTAVDTGYAMPETRAAWDRIFAERLDGRPVTRVIVTHYHPDHIGLAGWLCERWRVPLWITEKEWLHARMMSRGSDDFSPLRREFARRAGLDRRHANCSATAKRVTAAACRRCRRRFVELPTGWRSRSGGANGGSSSAKAMPRNSPVFIAPMPVC